MSTPWRTQASHLHGCPYCAKIYVCRLRPGYPIDLQRPFCDWGGPRTCDSCYENQLIVNVDYELDALRVYYDSLPPWTPRLGR